MTGAKESDAALVERALQLCARPTPCTEVQEQLRTLLRPGLPWQHLLERAEQEGLGAVLALHLETASNVPATVVRDTKAMQLRHRSLYAKRSAVLSQVLGAFAQASVRSLLLKGSGLALSVYPQPYLRAMRDLDILIRPQDAPTAAQALAAIGFSAAKADWDEHYHLEERFIEHEGVKVGVELHRKVQWELPWTLDELWENAVPVAVGESAGRTLGLEQALWLAYVHGFCLDTKKSESFRLIWVADVHALVETLCEGGTDASGLRERYPRLWRALPWFGVLTPWSVRVSETLRLPRLALPTRGLDSSHSALPLSQWRTQNRWTRARSAPLVWAGIRYGLSPTRLPGWLAARRFAAALRDHAFDARA